MLYTNSKILFFWRSWPVPGVHTVWPLCSLSWGLCAWHELDVYLLQHRARTEKHTQIRWKRLEKSCVILALRFIILYSKNLNLKMIIDDVSLSLSLWCSGRAFLWYLNLSMDLVQSEIATAGTAVVQSSTALTGLWEQHSTPFTLSGLCTGGWGLNDGGGVFGSQTPDLFLYPYLIAGLSSIKSSKYWSFFFFF